MGDGEDMLKVLERYGIHSWKELEAAVAKQEKLCIGIFVDPLRGKDEKDITDVGMHNNGLRMPAYECSAR